MYACVTPLDEAGIAWDGEVLDVSHRTPCLKTLFAVQRHAQRQINKFPRGCRVMVEYYNEDRTLISSETVEA